MKVVRFFVILLVSTFILASCRPNGHVLDNDTIAGSPSNADTVLPHKFHVSKSDSVKVDTENVPNRLKR